MKIPVLKKEDYDAFHKTSNKSKNSGELSVELINETEFVVPDDILSIYATLDSPHLRKFIIPEGVAKVHIVVYDCPKLESLHIPASVTDLSIRCKKNNYFKEITVDKNNPVYDSRNDCNAIINKSYKYPHFTFGCQNTIIPDKVAYIDTNAFRGCYNLHEIAIPDSVEVIGESAFYDCAGLNKIKLSNNLLAIASETFSYCSNLESIIIPDTVEDIYSAAFLACSSLKSVKLPDNLWSIGPRVFARCPQLQNVEYRGFNIIQFINRADEFSKPTLKIPLNELNKFIDTQKDLLMNKDDELEL